MKPSQKNKPYTLQFKIIIRYYTIMRLYKTRFYIIGYYYTIMQFYIIRFTTRASPSIDNISHGQITNQKKQLVL